MSNDCHLKVFSDIHKSVRSKLQATNTAMCATQHKRATPVTLQVGDFVMVRVPERESKLSSKFLGPRSVIQKLEGYKFVVWDPSTRTSETVHADRQKLTKAVPADGEPSPLPSPLHNNRPISPNPPPYNLRPRKYFFFSFWFQECRSFPSFSSLGPCWLLAQPT